MVIFTVSSSPLSINYVNFTSTVAHNTSTIQYCYGSGPTGTSPYRDVGHIHQNSYRPERYRLQNIQAEISIKTSSWMFCKENYAK